MSKRTTRVKNRACDDGEGGFGEFLDQTMMIISGRFRRGLNVPFFFFFFVRIKGPKITSFGRKLFYCAGEKK